MKEEKLYMAFKMFDIDGSGKISAEELCEILGSKEYIFYFFIKSSIIEDQNFSAKSLDYYK